MNKIKIYFILAILPLIISLFFVILSEPKMAAKIPFRDSLTKITKDTESYLSKKYPFSMGLDLSSGVRLTYKADTSKIPESEINGAMTVLRDVIEKRVNVFGVTEPTVVAQSSFLQNENRLLVELPGLTNINDAIKLIGETPLLEFQLVTGTSTLQKIGLDGRFLKGSKVVFDPQTNLPIVSIEWNEEGTKIFASTTKNNIGKSLAIILDGNIISAPTIQSEIPDGKAVITGNFTRDEVKSLVSRLNTGALPIPINVIGSEVIEPTFGAEALAAGVKASLYAFLFIVLLLIIWYRIPGVVGVVSLLTYAFITLAIFKIFGVTMSAAGIAGFIISVGLAVDGNILTFERLKEELKRGKKMREAVEEGFGRAWSSIRDSNFATLITAVILFFIGTTVIKGFALTLMIGVIISIFTNVFITRYLLRGLVDFKIYKNKLQK